MFCACRFIPILMKVLLIDKKKKEENYLEAEEHTLDWEQIWFLWVSQFHIENTILSVIVFWWLLSILEYLVTQLFPDHSCRRSNYGHLYQIQRQYQLTIGLVTVVLLIIVFWFFHL
jgi:hypothetical protein